MKKKEKKYGLLKGIIILILIAIVLSWLIPGGTAETGEYVTDGTLLRFGLNDIALLIYYGIYFGIDKIVLLVTVGGVYGVLTRTEPYKRLVSAIAKKLEKHKKIFVVVVSVFLAVLASLLTNVFIVLLFVPFIISILNRMKLDKMTIMATVFGSLLVGVLGATYGTEGLKYFNESMINGDTTTTELINDAVLIRAGILAIGLVLFNFFTLNHMSKKDKDNESAEMIPIEVALDAKKKSIIPLVIIGVIAFILVILGYINWSTNFGIEIFNDFHTMLTNIKIGNSFYIIKDLLGTNIRGFGTWDLFPMCAISLIFVVILALCYRVSFKEFVENFAAGVKKMIYPILCVMAAFMLMTAVYRAQIMPTIVNKLLTLTDGFNLATMSLSSLLVNIFHTDMALTAYFFGTFLATEYIDYINPVYVIFVSLYGFVQFFIPTSMIMGIGLTTLDVKYGDWLKYIFKFLIGMFICLMVIFILMSLI